MRKQDEAKSFSSARLPQRDTSSTNLNTVISVADLLKEWQASCLQSEELCRSENRIENAQFSLKLARACEILAEMVNANTVLSEQQAFWLREALTALPAQISMQDVIAGNTVAWKLVATAQWVNSCHP